VKKAPPAIGFARPDREYEALRAPIDQAIGNVLTSGKLILGEEVARFEQLFARTTGAKLAVGVSNGTDALVCALLALEIGAGDEVVTGAFGFVAAAEAISRVGATPVFADIEPASLALDAAAVRRARSERTRAIVSVDLFGVVHDLAPLRAAAPGVPIVEDAAQALGSTLGGRAAGTFGEIGTFSFFPSKTLGAAGDGGACVTGDARWAERISRIRLHGSGNAYAWETRGGNYRLDTLQAALLVVKLGALPERMARRKQIGEMLVATARKAAVTPIVGGADSEPIFAPLALRIEAARRDGVLARLREANVDARVHYPTTLSASPPFARYAQDQIFLEAERATRELLSVPCHAELTDDEVVELERALACALA
jgi:UDP-2-acetamido-2-deoxy-ribo-hexuluronate aminotransferase